MFGRRSVFSLFCVSVVWAVAFGRAEAQWGIGLDLGDIGGYYEKDGGRHEGWGVRVGGENGGIGYQQHRASRSRYHQGRGGHGRSRTHVGVGIYTQPRYVYEEPVYYVDGSADEEEVVEQAEEIPNVSDYARRAKEAFRDGRYEDALRLASHAIVETPDNGKPHLLASQALFALGNYRNAARAVHQAMTLLESEQWGHVVENYVEYYTDDAYVKQMERLVAFVKKNPDTAYARFLRGYHYGFLGYQEDAHRELTKAIELESRDKMARHLLVHFGGKPPGASAAAPEPRQPDTDPQG